MNVNEWEKINGAEILIFKKILKRLQLIKILKHENAGRIGEQYTN